MPILEATEARSSTERSRSITEVFTDYEYMDEIKKKLKFVASFAT